MIRYNQVPHLTQDTNEGVTNSQLDTTNESQEVSPFPAGDHKAHTNSNPVFIESVHKTCADYLHIQVTTSVFTLHITRYLVLKLVRE